MSRGILWLITTFIWLAAIVVTHAAALESLSDAGPLTPAFRWGYAAAFLVFGILLTGAAARMWPDAGPTIWRPFAVVFGAVVVLFELWLQSRFVASAVELEMWMAGLAGLAVAAVMPRLLPERWVCLWLRLERRAPRS